MNCSLSFLSVPLKNTKPAPSRKQTILTITLKALFQAHSNDTTLDRELFERAVKQVILQPDASVQLRLLNDIVV